MSEACRGFPLLIVNAKQLTLFYFIFECIIFVSTVVRSLFSNIKIFIKYSDIIQIRSPKMYLLVFIYNL